MSLFAVRRVKRGGAIEIKEVGESWLELSLPLSDSETLRNSLSRNQQVMSNGNSLLRSSRTSQAPGPKPKTLPLAYAQQEHSQTPPKLIDEP